MNRPDRSVPAAGQDVQAYLASLPPRAPFWKRDIASVRRDARADALLACGAPEPVATVEDLEADGVPARLYRPEHADVGALVWFHGGSWMWGDLDACDTAARALANRSRRAVLSVDYRLAPEHPFPAAVEDAWRATHWAATRFARIAVAGESAGGNLAAVVALRARNAKLPIVHQLLVYPAVELHDESPFMWAFEQRYSRFGGIDAYGEMSRIAVRRVLDVYIPDHARRRLVDASPMRAETLRGVAPATLLTAEHDILRGQAEEYARRLRADDVPVELHDFPGQVHGFFTLQGAMRDARYAMEVSAAAVRDAFDAGPR